jgi:HSP20 family molecular chaperone IbpA
MSPKNTIEIRKLDSLAEEIDNVESRIRERAYEIFLQRGGTDGHDQDDWFQAKEELVATPPLTLVEMEDHFLVLLSLPGIDIRDVEILASKESLVVQTSSRPLYDASGHTHVREIDSRHTFRPIFLTQPIQPESIRVEYHNGILRLTASFAEKPAILQAKTA